MDLRPIKHARRRHEPRGRGTASVATLFRRALCLAGFCIAAFESSQLIFNSAGRPSWADASEQMARADVAPRTAPALYREGRGWSETGRQGS